MRYSEFIAKIQSMPGFSAEMSGNSMLVFKMNYETNVPRILASISAETYQVVELGQPFLTLDYHRQKRMYDAIRELADTPLEFRKDEKYVIYWIDNQERPHLLHKSIAKGFILNEKPTQESIKTLFNGSQFAEDYIFTEVEIMRIPKKWRPTEFFGIGFTEHLEVL